MPSVLCMAAGGLRAAAAAGLDRRAGRHMSERRHLWEQEEPGEWLLSAAAAVMRNVFSPAAQAGEPHHQSTRSAAHLWRGLDPTGALADRQIQRCYAPSAHKFERIDA